MQKLTTMINGNRPYFISTLAIMVTLITVSLALGNYVGNIKSEISEDIKIAVDENIDIHNKAYDSHPCLMEALEEIKVEIEKNHKETINLINGK